jgi:hypothetical protein
MIMKLRTLLLVVGPMLFVGPAQADVLALSNTSGTNGTTSSGGLGLDIDFRVNASTSFNGISLFRTGGGTVNFEAFQNTGSGYTSMGPAVNNVSGNFIAVNEYFFSAGAGSSLVFNTGVDYRLRVTLIESGFETTANSVLTLPGDSPIASSPTPTTNVLGSTGGAGYARFQLYAVPEPGTLILGSLAAISGGAGAWWKRRKQKSVGDVVTQGVPLD